MGFFSGSSTTTVTPISKLFDAGIFSQRPENEATRGLATQLQGVLGQSAFLQNPAILNELISSLTNLPESTEGGSFLSDPQRGSIIDQAQAQFNKRGLSRITENEALSALAPFELQARQLGIQSRQAETQARQEGTNRLAGLIGARGFDLDALFKLIQESRPDLLVGSTTTSKTSPSGLASLSGLLSLGQQAGSLFGAGGSFGGAPLKAV